MRQFLIIGGALAALTTSSFAADMPIAAPEAAVVAETYDWSGFYVGVQGGGAWGETAFDDGVESNPFDIEGFVVGGTAGYNLQVAPSFVAGIEADVSFADISGDATGDIGAVNGVGWGCGTACVTDVEWFATVRGRVGPSFGPVYIYATGGFAVAGIEADVEDVSILFNDDVSVGWTAGAGLEYMFAGGWSAKVEYLHVDLDFQDPNGAANFAADAEFDLVRGGINYRF